MIDAIKNTNKLINYILWRTQYRKRGHIIALLKLFLYLKEKVITKNGII